MKRSLLLISMATAALMAGASQWDNGQWSVVLDNNVLDVKHGGEILFHDVFASVTYNLAGEETEYTIKSNSGITPTEAQTDISDEFGSGISYTLSYSDGHAVMTHRFNFYDSHPYFIVNVELKSADGTARVESRHMEPFSAARSSYPCGSSNTNMRSLQILADNETWDPMRSYRFGSTSKTSSEVTAIFDAETRRGVVVGSVDHDKWKSGIQLDTKTGGRLASMQVLSGWTDPVLTKDVLPHGKVKGETVSSSRFMVGVFDDWRDGLDTFAEANTLVQPRRVWKGGTPVGWNSWGNMMNHINYDGVLETARFIQEQLRPLGFYGKDGKIAISLDSFNDNVGSSNLSYLGNKLFAEGKVQVGKNEYIDGWNMSLGMYGGMVVWDWTLGSKIPGTGLGGTRDYYWNDVLLKVNGEKFYYNGEGAKALACDPTHPAWRANMENQFAKWARLGAKYVKMDFMNAPMREGDSWYNPDITTGVMAYNYGMEIVRELSDKYDMYVVLSMAPMFPYQYAHARRTCCDAWGRLGESERVMNAISYAWWTDKFYINDPDQMTLHQNEQNHSETIGENRVRVTSGMCTGAFIFGDNLSDHCYYTDNTDNHNKGEICGYPAESRERALQLLGNADINEYVRNNDGSFRPVEGDNQDVFAIRKSEALFVRDTPQYLYLAVFNWSSSSEFKGTAAFERIGIKATNVGKIKELWSGDEIIPSDEGIDYAIPACDVKVYRITKNDYVPDESAIDEITASAAASLSAVISGGLCRVSSSEPLTGVEILDMSGKTVASSAAAEFEISVAPGIYIVNCRMASGARRAVKAVAK